MSSFDEVKAQVEGLWAEELDDLRRERGEFESRVADVWRASEEHQGHAAVLSQQLAAARSELKALPGKMNVCMLEDDQAEIVALQGRHAALKGTVASVAQALEDEHALIGEASIALQAAEADGHALNVRENDLKREIWDEFKSLDTSLLHHFARSIGVERLPTRVAAEREQYAAAVHREAQRLGSGEPAGIVVKNPSPREVPEPITVRPSQLAPRG